MLEQIPDTGIKPSCGKTTLARILIVDDEKLVRWSVGEALSKNNYTVELAGSGEEAVKKAQSLFDKKELGFDLVISDLKMDGMTGIEVAQEMKRISPETKVMVITAFHSELDEQQLRNKSISVWLEKPFEMHRLTEIVQQLLG